MHYRALNPTARDPATGLHQKIFAILRLLFTRGSMPPFCCALTHCLLQPLHRYRSSRKTRQNKV